MSDDLPVTSTADVLSVAPAFIKAADTAEVRDAIVAALTAMFQEYQGLAAYAAANVDVLRATGTYLDYKLETERGVRRSPGEADEDYRFRGLQFQDVVSPSAIVAAVNAIIAPAVCTYSEASVDRLFISGGTGSWHSFIGSRPSYPSRYYTGDSVANGGVVLANRDPGRGRIFASNQGRHFVIQVPNLKVVDTTVNAVGNGTITTGFYVYDGSVSTRRYMYSNTTSSQAVYNLIIATVNRLRGTSMRWSLIGT